MVRRDLLLVCLELAVCLLVLAAGDKMEYNSISDKSRYDKTDKVTLDRLWNQYMQTHNKNYYSKEEEQRRRHVWEDRLEEIWTHNLEYDMGLHTYTLGINQYSDLTPEEYKKYLLGLRVGPLTGQPFPLSDLDLDLPDTVDWRTKGYVTPVKNQGNCGSCWAFSATGALEGAHYKTYGKLVPLSEQNLVDCTTSYGNAGCNGGWMDNAFRYVQENNGIDTEAHYPYEGRDDRCDYSPDPAFKGSNCTGHVHVTQGSEKDLQKAVALIGPVSVAIDATQSSFGQYRSGVYDEPKCSNTSTDHAVLVVGYGTYKGLPYWLVKNSWGTSWGDGGYIMMSRNKNNQCAIATYASYPTA